jgi:hypothetical protein
MSHTLTSCNLQLSGYKFVFHPEVLYKYNVSVNNAALYLIYNKNSVLSGLRVSTFIRSSSGPLGKQIQELCFIALWDPKMR